MSLNYRQFLDSLEGVRQSGADKWTAHCPAHEDRSPSLSIKLDTARDGSDTLLIHCHAGCSPYDILHAVGLEWRDLFDGSDDRPRRTRSRRKDADIQHDRWIVKIAREWMRSRQLTPEERETLTGAMERLADDRR